MKNEEFLSKLPSIVKKQPANLASLSKFVEGEKNTDKINTKIDVRPIVTDTTYKIKHNDEIMKMFPDVELPIQILVSSIISPNDMVTVNLNYQSPENLRLTQDVKAALLTTIKEYVEKEYNIEGKLYDVVKQALFTKGAHPIAIIPESALDDIINQAGNTSFEHMVDYYTSGKNNRKFNLSLKNYQMELISNNKKESYGMEDLLGINVTENMSILKLKDYKISGLSKKNKSKYTNISLEEDELLDQLFRPKSEYQPIETIKVNSDELSSRKSITKPLVLDLPVESVIPIHIKNNPDKHLGYFIALDETGVPVTSDYTDRELYTPTTDLSNSINSLNGDTKLSMISRARSELYGMTKDSPQLNNMDSTYDQLLQSYLKTLIKDGEIGDIGTISENFDLYNVMLNRALSNQKTNLLYIPAELVSYLAFDYRDNGTGESLLERCAILYSIRAIVFFTRILANIRNNISSSSVEVDMDENIPNPRDVQEIVMSEFLKTRESAFPIGISRVDDIVNYIHRVGYRFNFKHPGLPGITISQTDEQSSKVVPDIDFDQDINSLILMSFGLTPEIVQSGIESDFATTFSAKNMLFAKRVTAIQTKLNDMITDRVRKLLLCDPIIKDKITTTIQSNLKAIKKTFKSISEDLESSGVSIKKMSDKKIIDYLASVFLSEINITLPKIELIEANGNKQAFEDYKTVLTDTLDFVFDESKLTEDIIGPLANKIPLLKTVIGTVSLNKWLTDNNYLPELSQFLTKDEDGKPLLDVVDEFNNQIKNLYDAFIPHLKSNKKFIDNMTEKFDQIENGTTESDEEDYEDGDEEVTDKNLGDTGEEDVNDDNEGDILDGFGDPDMDDGFADSDMSDEGGEKINPDENNLEDELTRAKTRKELMMAEVHRAKALKEYQELRDNKGLDVDEKIDYLDKLQSKDEGDDKDTSGDLENDMFGVDESGMGDFDLGGDLDDNAGSTEEPKDDKTPIEESKKEEPKNK